MKICQEKREMRYRMRMATDAAKEKLNQDFEAETDEEALEEVHDFMEHTGFPVRAVTRIGLDGEETIIKTFSPV